jgi:hypothetical protein
MVLPEDRTEVVFCRFPNMDKIQVIYIAGQGRSGSTLIDRILGTLDGVASMAEVYRVLKDGVVAQKCCACGAGIETCPFWSGVMARMDPIKVANSLMLQDAIDHSRYVLALLTGQYSPHFRNKLEAYKIFLQQFYEAIAQQTGCRILVDSSKVPSRALILSKLPNIDVHLVHLVRDVRGVIYAWQSDKYDPASGQSINKFPAHQTFAAWVFRNFMCELIGHQIPYYRIRYETFVQHPQKVMQNLVGNLAPLAEQTIPFLDERSIKLPLTHSIGGNPDRFQSGVTRIIPDNRWISELSPFVKGLSAVLGSPLLYRYGYFCKIFSGSV